MFISRSPASSFQFIISITYFSLIAMFIFHSVSVYSSEYLHFSTRLLFLCFFPLVSILCQWTGYMFMYENLRVHSHVLIISFDLFQALCYSIRLINMCSNYLGIMIALLPLSWGILSNQSVYYLLLIYIVIILYWWLSIRFSNIFLLSCFIFSPIRFR